MKDCGAPSSLPVVCFDKRHGGDMKAVGYNLRKDMVERQAERGAKKRKKEQKLRDDALACLECMSQ